MPTVGSVFCKISKIGNIRYHTRAPYILKTVYKNGSPYNHLRGPATQHLHRQGASPELSIFEKYINIPNTSLFFWKIQLWGRPQGAQETPEAPGALRIIFHGEAKILYEVMLKKY